MEDMNPNAVALVLKVARRSGAITDVETRWKNTKKYTEEITPKTTQRCGSRDWDFFTLKVDTQVKKQCLKRR
jgi:hypothetical protein